MAAHDDEKNVTSFSKPEMLELGQLDEQSLKAESADTAANINEAKQKGALERLTLMLLRLGVETEGWDPW